MRLLFALLVLFSFSAHAENAKQLWLDAEAASTKPTVAVGKWEAVVKAIPAGQTAGEGLTHDMAQKQLLHAYLNAAKANKDASYITKARTLGKNFDLNTKIYADIVISKAAISFDKKMALKLLKSAHKNAMQLKSTHKKSESLHSIALAALTETKEGKLLFGWDGIELAEDIIPHITLGIHRAPLMQTLAGKQEPSGDAWNKKLHQIVAVSDKKNEKKRNKALIALHEKALQADKFMIASKAIIAITDSSLQQKKLYTWFKKTFDKKEYSRAASISQYIDDGKYAANSWGKLAVYYSKQGEKVRSKDASEKSLEAAITTRREDRRLEALIEAADYAGESNNASVAAKALKQAGLLQSSLSNINSEKTSRAAAVYIKALSENNQLDEAKSRLNDVKLLTPEHRTLAVSALAKKMAEAGKQDEALDLLSDGDFAKNDRLDNAYYAVAKALVEAGNFEDAEKAAAQIQDSKDKIKINAFIKSKRQQSSKEDGSNSALGAPFFSSLNQQINSLPATDQQAAMVDLAEMFSKEEALPIDGWIAKAANARVKDNLIASKSIGLAKRKEIEKASRLMKTLDDPIRRAFAFRRLAKEISLHTDAFGFIGDKVDPIIQQTRDEIFAAADETQIATSELETRLNKLTKEKKAGLEMAAPVSSDLGLIIPEMDYPERLEFDYDYVKAQLPPLTPFTLEEVYYENSFFINTKFKITIAYSEHNLDNGIVAPNILYLQKGTTSLPLLYDELRSRGLNDYITRKGKEYTLNSGLLVGPDATLVIDGAEVSKLYQSQQHSAILVNAGNIYITGTSVIGWDIENKKPVYSTHADRYDFRPFIASWSRSHTYLAGNEFVAIGYSNHKSYGISLSAGPEKLQLSTISEPTRPDGIIVDNSFDNVYYGFYSYEADNVSLIGNEYRDNIIYGIDPHDRSNWLTIAYNTAYEAQKKHGIIISREVNDSSFIGNLSFDNKGSGFMIDRLSTGTFVYGNTAFGNKQDGLTVFESSCNYITSNSFFNNKSMGIRIRNSQDNGVFFNNLSNNKQGGLMAYISELLDDPAHKRRNFTLDPYSDVAAMSVVGNHIEKNGAGIIGENLSAVLIRGNRFTDQSPRMFSGKWFTDNSYFTSQYSIRDKGVLLADRCPKGKWMHHPCRFRKDGLYKHDGQSQLESRVVNSSCQTRSKQDVDV